MVPLMKTGNPDNYWERIRKRLMEFWKPGDYVQCVKVFPNPNSTCQLCGHVPITWNHVLRNDRTSEDLRVGSKCVHNYKEIIEEMGYGGPVDFHPKYHRAVKYINGKYPGTAKVVSQEDSRDSNYYENERIYFVDRPPNFIDGDPEELYGYSLPDEDLSGHEVGYDYPAEGLSPYEIDWDSCDYD